ncbi:MAG TPA: V-type ATP synthase subunit E family protein [Thermoplasmata archaeon]|nr:V-type ATP synthase subunit E family protein [Thermoplasmata archaeon]
MPLERLLEEIESRARQELDAFEHQRAEEIRQQLSERDRRIQQIRSEGERGGRAEAARENAQRIASAKLAARRMLYEAQEKQFADAFSRVRQMLADFTKGPGYAPTLKALYAYATSRLGKGTRIRGRPEDAALLRSIAGRNLSDGSAPILGGLIAETPDGSRRLNLTFDELLRLKEDRLREILRDD